MTIQLVERTKLQRAETRTYSVSRADKAAKNWRKKVTDLGCTRCVAPSLNLLASVSAMVTRQPQSIIFLICRCSYRYIATDLCSKGSEQVVDHFGLSSCLKNLCFLLHDWVPNTLINHAGLMEWHCLADHRRCISCHHEATQPSRADTGGLYRNWWWRPW
jgi:hypothetical protein